MGFLERFFGHCIGLQKYQLKDDISLLGQRQGVHQTCNDDNAYAPSQGGQHEELWYQFLHLRKPDIAAVGCSGIDWTGKICIVNA